MQRVTGELSAPRRGAEFGVATGGAGNGATAARRAPSSPRWMLRLGTATDQLPPRGGREARGQTGLSISRPGIAADIRAPSRAAAMRCAKQERQPRHGCSGAAASSLQCFSAMHDCHSGPHVRRMADPTQSWRLAGRGIVATVAAGRAYVYSLGRVWSAGQWPQSWKFPCRPDRPGTAGWDDDCGQGRASMSAAARPAGYGLNPWMLPPNALSEIEGMAGPDTAPAAAITECTLGPRYSLAGPHTVRTRAAATERALGSLRHGRAGRLQPNRRAAAVERGLQRRHGMAAECSPGRRAGGGTSSAVARPRLR
jgi:hypothetical protein